MATITRRGVAPQGTGTTTTAPAIAPARTGTSFLPSPPSDHDKLSYLEPHQRWVPVVSAFGGLLTIASLVLLVEARPWALPLLPILLLSSAALVISFLSARRKRRDTVASHRAIIESWRPASIPSVDVFLPSAGEPLDVLDNTYHHVARLEWNGELRVHVLDDSARSSVKQLAESYGFIYRSRPDRGHLKKAGNLRHGFDNSTGDIIAVLDADFVPRPDYLRELVPYLDDQKLGIVQSPQYFDVDPSMNWVQHAAGATQILFYRWIQPSRDASNAPICVGTCALYRRSALAAAGGFAQIGHSEDVHTGVQVMNGGYQVRYVPVVLAKGLCPDDLDQFVSQQYRWCTGSMSLLRSKPFHAMRLSIMQRVCYWAGFLYYITTGIGVMVVALPPILMALIAPEAVEVRNYVLVLLALIVRMGLVPIVTLEKESFFRLTRIQATYSFAHAIALLDAVRGRADSWQATGIRGPRTTTAARVRRLAIATIATTQVLLWATILWRAPTFGWIDYAPMALLAALGLYTLFPLLLWRSGTTTNGARS
ncbi:glycosyltransferase family 2 protein [Lolliginicoccus suaedae]|uniref:glycosyltransferase family 2 protein n=1 Tax=Lolliginicoccus suaedae TaxID=2605429 RepID=UPI0016598ABA|nr:cellulose synthase catalytic subunit [Lolliginicoccus suaedae]